MDRIFSIVPDRCQILLYEKHGLCFITAVFEICPAYVYCGGEINFFRGNHGDFQMSGRHAEYSGEPTVSAGAVEIGKFRTAGIAGEIKCREQEALSRKPESDHTESEISSTEQAIAGIMQRVKRESEGRTMSGGHRLCADRNGVEKG